MEKRLGEMAASVQEGREGLSDQADKLMDNAFSGVARTITEAVPTNEEFDQMALSALPKSQRDEYKRRVDRIDNPTAIDRLKKSIGKLFS